MCNITFSNTAMQDFKQTLEAFSIHCKNCEVNCRAITFMLQNNLAGIFAGKHATGQWLLNLFFFWSTLLWHPRCADGLPLFKWLKGLHIFTRGHWWMWLHCFSQQPGSESEVIIQSSETSNHCSSSLYSSGRTTVDEYKHCFSKHAFLWGRVLFVFLVSPSLWVLGCVCVCTLLAAEKEQACATGLSMNMSVRSQMDVRGTWCRSCVCRYRSLPWAQLVLINTIICPSSG